MIVMNAVYEYLMAWSWAFLLGWIALLLVAYVLAFRGGFGLAAGWYVVASDLARES